MEFLAFLLIALGVFIDIASFGIFTLLLPVFKALKPKIPCSDGHCVFIWSDFLSRDSAFFWYPFFLGLFLIGCGLLIIYTHRKD